MIVVLVVSYILKIEELISILNMVDIMGLETCGTNKDLKVVNMLPIKGNHLINA